MKILLIGYYGYGNIGDEALLKATLDSIDAHVNATCTVLSYNAEATERDYGVKTISRGKHMALIRAIRKNDAVIVGGGSILQDITSSLSLYYYLMILMIARLLGKKTYLVGNGYGPITKRHNQIMIKWLVSGLNGVVARDDNAYNAYKQLGVKRIFNGVDLAYLLRADTFKTAQIDQKYVVISLRPWHNTSVLIPVISEVITYLNGLDYKVYLLPMKHPDDTMLLNKLSKKHSNIELIDHDINKIMCQLKGASFVIGMRLHALILSAVVGVPFIGISYDPKVDSFVSQVMDIVPIASASASYDDIKNEINDIVQHYDAMKTRVKSSTERNQIIAQQQMHTFITWLKHDI